MFYAISAAVIGGTALTGGRGTAIGVALGAIVLGVLNVGFNIVGLSAYTFQLILGIAIVASMIVNSQFQRAAMSRLGRRRLNL
jgi:simple sugar transport system permease protein